MGTVNDSSTQLNTNTTSGDTMDESAPDRLDGAVRKRARVVLSGDTRESAVIDPVKTAGEWTLPVSSTQLAIKLDIMVNLLTRINKKLAVLSSQLE